MFTMPTHSLFGVNLKPHSCGHCALLASRRQVLTAIAGGVAALWDRPSAVAQTVLSPDAALTRLIEGNDRFVQGKLASLEEDLAILKEHTVSKQEPFAAVLSCADSRVPVELIFDQSIGDLFVTRVAGNIVTPEIIASLEYGVAVLGVETLVVLGHSSCGAVKAAMKAEEVPGQ